MEASSIVSHNDSKLYFIQGPPGTGKSTTIVAIINAIFARIECMHANNHQQQQFKLLIWSPSNGGCYELVRKISDIRRSNKSYLKTLCNRDIKIIRLGRNESIHMDSGEFNLDTLSKKKCEELICKTQAEKTTSLNDQYKNFKNIEKMLDSKIKIGKTTAGISEKQIKELEAQKVDLCKRKEKFEQQLKKNWGQIPQNVRYKQEQQAKEMILREADIIVCTLNFCGNSLLDCLTADKNKGKSLVNLLIIDEAAQSLEVDSLIPLRFGCNKIIQVGDPEQLPATVLSTKAKVIRFFEFIYKLRSYWTIFKELMLYKALQINRKKKI